MFEVSRILAGLAKKANEKARVETRRAGSSSAADAEPARPGRVFAGAPATGRTLRAHCDWTNAVLRGMLPAMFTDRTLDRLGGAQEAGRKRSQFSTSDLP